MTDTAMPSTLAASPPRFPGEPIDPPQKAIAETLQKVDDKVP